MGIRSHRMAQIVLFSERILLSSMITIVHRLNRGHTMDTLVLGHIFDSITSMNTGYTRFQFPLKALPFTQSAPLNFTVTPFAYYFSMYHTKIQFPFNSRSLLRLIALQRVIISECALVLKSVGCCVTSHQIIITVAVDIIIEIGFCVKRLIMFTGKLLHLH